MASLLAIVFLAGLSFAAIGLAATYLVYPALVVLWARARQASRIESVPPEAAPRVSFVVTAYNEADAIREKLDNTIELDYPADRLEVLVASDGSTDATDTIVAEYPDERVRLIRNPERGGKTATTNLAVEQATGELLVFSDATGRYEPGALEALVAPFQDPSVGAVSGRVVYSYGDTPTARGFGLYQRWVVAQRRAETSLHTATSVSGSIHAVRRSTFEAVPAHLSYDMVVPALVAIRAQRAVYADGAVSHEVSREHARDEFAARARIAVRAWAFLSWLRANRARVVDRLYLIELFFHKVLRWLSPHLLLLLLVCHAGLALLRGGAWTLALMPHLALYALAALAVMTERGLRVPGQGALVLFATFNTAYALGYVRWLRGTRLAAWTPERGTDTARS